VMPRGAESHTVRRVTLDTAILVREQGTTLVLSESILGEFERVWPYPRRQKLYGWTADEVVGVRPPRGGRGG